ncbi:RNA-dependent RNA polymerase [Aspergillus fumigatus partitivirus 2]|uniref:RNA-dependent RNA polymerase n=1 Tax=Aspergillus fumigatus partitivirus 2 TaxID=2250452 RepID=UPI000DF5ECA9|nr:RNA-dependent RNA polymerase [Aspergillus fumigatus partitivirus 2]AXE72935.1 RNA-dependent RNA polymerase [Aspergillus fumigatus partitivirus 2]
MLLTEIPNVYQRAVALERRIRLRELYPEGVVPYLAKQEYDGAIAGPHGPHGSVAPSVTTTFQAKLPLDQYPDRKYTLECKETMIYLGKMDGYPFSSSIPKFDPWFRKVLKDKDPAIVKDLEDTFMRDPCTPDRVMKHMSLFDRTWKRMPTGRLMSRAKDIVAKMFEPIGKVEPIDFNFAGWHKILPNLDMTSSPGLPLRREYQTQGECLGHIYDKTKRLNHFAKFLHPAAVRAPPCMIGVRPGLIRRDEYNEKVKARGVWAYPAEVKVMEMRFVQPLIERMSLNFMKIPYPVGRNMTKALPMLIDHMLHDKKKGFVTDVSNLDASVGPDYIDWAFSLMKTWFNFGITQSSETRNANVFDFLHYYFKRTPILLPSGQLVKKAGGVPSGSGFTQLVDTLVTILATVYTLLRMGWDEDQIIKGYMQVVGDDMAVSVPRDFDPEEFVYLMGSLGFTINLKKVMFSDKGIELKFLGYSKYGGSVYRPLDELLQTAFFPEKFVGNPERSRMRIAGQTLASGMTNAFFSKVNYWMEELVSLATELDPDEVFIPQRRWLRIVLGLDEMPSTTLAFDMFPLV